MLKNSPKRIGELLTISVEWDDQNREIEMPAPFLEALKANVQAKAIFDQLSASRRLEIVRYLANLKTEQALERNIGKALRFLLGQERFVGRDLP
jgi:uncharacterized protein YdeI (YjbR/CyaY-like superfamily)